MRHLIHIWPTITELATDLGLPYQTVASWGKRGVPPRRYAQLITVAKRKGHVLTFDELASAEMAGTPTNEQSNEAAA